LDQKRGVAGKTGASGKNGQAEDVAANLERKKRERQKVLRSFRPQKKKKESRKTENPKGRCTET